VAKRERKRKKRKATENGPSAGDASESSGLPEEGERRDETDGREETDDRYEAEAASDEAATVGYDEAARVSGPRTLSIDIGGTGIKATVLNSRGERLNERVRVPTPKPGRPDDVLEALAGLASSVPDFDRVSVGFPGVVRDGRTYTAPNLDTEAWVDVDLAGAVAERLGRPARVLNDAELQGLGVIEGRGIEMIVTLGTGFGCGIYRDGRVSPHLELGHHAFRKGQTYEEQLSDATLKRIGRRKWNKHLRRAIASLRKLVNFDRLYIGGGNAKRIDLDLDPDVTVVTNVAGLRGGIALWRDEDERRRAWADWGGNPEVL
jgi:polyphosphate glucokinase